jgi:hypothetical protein
MSENKRIAVYWQLGDYACIVGYTSESDATKWMEELRLRWVGTGVTFYAK